MERVQQRATKTKGMERLTSKSHQKAMSVQLGKDRLQGEIYLNLKRRCKEGILSVDGKQWAQNETQEIPFKHKKKLLHSEGCQTLEQTVQRG